MNSVTDWGWPLLADMSWAFWIESLFSSWESPPSPKIIQHLLISGSAFQSCPAPLGASMSLRPFQSPVTTGILESLKCYSCSGLCFKREKFLCQPSRKHYSFVSILTKRWQRCFSDFFLSTCPSLMSHSYVQERGIIFTFESSLITATKIFYEAHHSGMPFLPGCLFSWELPSPIANGSLRVHPASFLNHDQTSPMYS